MKEEYGCIFIGDNTIFKCHAIEDSGRIIAKTPTKVPFIFKKTPLLGNCKSIISNYHEAKLIDLDNGVTDKKIRVILSDVYTGLPLSKISNQQLQSKIQILENDNQYLYSLSMQLMQRIKSMGMQGSFEDLVKRQHDFWNNQLKSGQMYNLMDQKNKLEKKK